MNKEFCSYCGKEIDYNKLIDFDFYGIGEYACKKCAKERILEIQNEIIPLILNEYNIKI